MTYLNEDKYSGFWCEGKRNGKGIYKSHLDYTYEGYYKNDKKHGEGFLRFPDGSYYMGEWFEGMK